MSSNKNLIETSKHVIKSTPKRPLSAGHRRHGKLYAENNDIRPFSSKYKETSKTKVAPTILLNEPLNVTPPKPSQVIANTMCQNGPNIINRFRTSNLSSNVNQACVNYNKFASRTLSNFNNEMSDVLRESIAHLDTISLKVHATLHNLQDEECILSGLNSYSRVLDEQRKFFEYKKFVDNFNVCNVVNIPDVKKIKGLDKLTPSVPIKEPPRPESPAFANKEEPNPPTNKVIAKTQRKRKPIFKQPQRPITSGDNGSKKTVYDVLSSYNEADNSQRRNKSRKVILKAEVPSCKNSFQLRKDYAKQLNRSAVALEEAPKPERGGKMAHELRKIAAEDLEASVNKTLDKHGLDVVGQQSRLHEVKKIPSKLKSARRSNRTCCGLSHKHARDVSALNQVSSLTVNVASKPIVQVSSQVSLKVDLNKNMDTIIDEEEKARLLKDRYILKTIQGRPLSKKGRSFDICLPQNFRKIRKNKMVNECYVNEKFEDSLWFGPKLKQEISKCSVSSVQNKLIRRDGDFNLLNFSKPRSPTTPRMSEVEIPKVYDKKCCIIMETQRSPRRYELRQNSAIGTSCILEEITLKDLEPLKAEYPRRDNQFKPERSIEDTFLYQLVHDLNTKPLEVLVNATPDIHCSTKRCNCKSMKRLASKNKQLRTKFLKYPLENKAAIGDIHEIIDEQTIASHYYDDDKKVSKHKDVDKSPSLLRTVYNVDLSKLKSTENRMKLAKFMLDPSGKIPPQMYTVLPVIVSYDRDDWNSPQNHSMGDVKPVSSKGTEITSGQIPSEKSALTNITLTKKRTKKSNFTEVNRPSPRLTPRYSSTILKSCCRSLSQESKHKAIHGSPRSTHVPSSPKNILKPYIYATNTIFPNSPPTTVMMVDTRIDKVAGERKKMKQRNFSNTLPQKRSDSKSSSVESGGSSKRREKKYENLTEKALWNNKYAKTTGENLLTFINKHDQHITPALTPKTPAHKMPRINSPGRHVPPIVMTQPAPVVRVLLNPRQLSPTRKTNRRPQTPPRPPEVGIQSVIAQMEAQIEAIMSDPSKQSTTVFKNIEREIKDILATIKTKQKTESCSTADSNTTENKSGFMRSKSNVNEPKKPLSQTARSKTVYNFQNIEQMAHQRLLLARDLLSTQQPQETPQHLHANKLTAVNKKKAVVGGGSFKNKEAVNFRVTNNAEESPPPLLSPQQRKRHALQLQVDELFNATNEEVAYRVSSRPSHGHTVKHARIDELSEGSDQESYKTSYDSLTPRCTGSYYTPPETPKSQQLKAKPRPRRKLTTPRLQLAEPSDSPVEMITKRNAKKASKSSNDDCSSQCSDLDLKINGNTKSVVEEIGNTLSERPKSPAKLLECRAKREVVEEMTPKLQERPKSPVKLLKCRPKGEVDEEIVPKLQEHPKSPVKLAESPPKREVSEEFAPKLSERPKSPNKLVKSPPKREVSEEFAPKLSERPKSPIKLVTSAPKREVSEEFAPKLSERPKSPIKLVTSPPKREVSEEFAPKLSEHPKSPIKLVTSPPKREGSEQFASKLLERPKSPIKLIESPPKRDVVEEIAPKLLEGLKSPVKLIEGPPIREVKSKQSKVLELEVMLSQEELDTKISIEELEKKLGEQTKKFCEEVDEVIKEVREKNAEVNPNPTISNSTNNILLPPTPEEDGNSLTDETKLVRSDEFLTPYMRAVKKFRVENQKSSNFIDFLENLSTITDVDSGINTAMYESSDWMIDDAKWNLDSDGTFSQDALSQQTFEECAKLNKINSDFRPASYTEQVFVSLLQEVADREKLEENWSQTRSQESQSTQSESPVVHAENQTTVVNELSQSDSTELSHVDSERLFYERERTESIEFYNRHMRPLGLSPIASEECLKEEVHVNEANFDINPMGEMFKVRVRANCAELPEVVKPFEFRDACTSARISKFAESPPPPADCQTSYELAPTTPRLRIRPSSRPSTATSEPRHLEDMIQETTEVIGTVPEVFGRLSSLGLQKSVSNYKFLTYVYGVMFATVFFGLNMHYNCQ